jgi:hypothetical protein
MKNNVMYTQTKYIIKNIQCRLEKKSTIYYFVSRKLTPD